MSKRKNKQTFPALYKEGFIHITEGDIDRVFLPLGATSPKRQRLATLLRFFIKKLQSTGVKGELWINGSFSTKNLEPMDYDVLLVIPRVTLAGMSKEGKIELEQLTNEKNKEYVRAKWNCDLYVIEASDAANRTFYEKYFSRNPDELNRKGIPVISI
jgi:hypothetical protein